MEDEKPWIDDVITALLLLGGEGSLPDLYRSVASIRDVSLKINWKASVRRTIEQHSSDSDAFTGQADLFYSARGIGNGRWGFRKYLTDRSFIQEESEETGHAQRRIGTYAQIIRRIKIIKDLKTPPRQQMPTVRHTFGNRTSCLLFGRTSHKTSRKALRWSRH